MTIGELKLELQEWPDHFTITFGSPELQFNELKKQGPTTVQLRFNQTIYKAEDGWHVEEHED